MEAKDTVIHNEGCPATGYMTGGSLGGKKIHYACTCGREAQAEISFKAGREEEYKRWVLSCMRTGMLISEPEQLTNLYKAGIREVVEWIMKYRSESTREFICLTFIKKDWEAFLKDKGE